MTGMSDADGTGVPAGSGRARDLVGRRRQRPVPETGRVHHLGAAPAVMPVLGEDKPAEPAEETGTAATAPAAVPGSTRTAAVQLASRTRWELEQLLAELQAEMAGAAGALDFETAARARDEVARVQAELDRRPTG
jgi:hypothetical protein